MLNQAPYFHGLLRKYQSYFAYIFSTMHIERDATDGSVAQLIKVPLQFASKNKQLLRTDADPNIQKDTSITLPRMSYAYTDFQYNGSRMLPATNMAVGLNTANAQTMNTLFIPVPYDVTFKLYIYVNQLEDGTRIIEQILPKFTPDFTATLNLIPEINEKKDIPIILESVSQEDVYQGPMEVNRAIIYTLSFKMQCYFYGPVVAKPIIDFVNENFYFDANSGLLETIVTQPGMDANGNPTTLAANSIPVANIFATNNYGYVVHANGIIKIANN